MQPDEKETFSWRCHKEQLNKNNMKSQKVYVYHSVTFFI